MRIAISGLSGCGNTTVSNLVSKKLGFPNINFTFRNLASEKGLSFSQICELSKNDDSYDIELDKRQVEMAMSLDNCILASRLAIWMLKNADYKFFIDVSAHERARRIFIREGGKLEDKIIETQNRDTIDTKRYKRIYNIDNTYPQNVADYIISDDKLSAEEIANFILSKVGFEYNTASM